MRPIELSPRLLSVAQLVPPNAVLVDVGTDHAFLPIYLLQRDLISKAIATDLREGPLSKAKANGKKYGFMDKMSFRLCDGLAGVSSQEADTIAIAGMGGETIAAILKAAPWTRTGSCTLLLQPMSSLYDLRKFLTQNGYHIQMEHLRKDGRRVYVTMEVEPGDAPPYTEGEMWAGRQWKGMDSPLRSHFLVDMEKRAERALHGLAQSVRESDLPRRARLEQILPQVKALREEWISWQR